MPRGSNFALILQRTPRRNHGCSSNNYRDSPISNLIRLRIVVFAIDPITNTGAHTVTSAGTHTIANAITDAGDDRINCQRRAQFDDNRLRSESNHGRCWRCGDVDEQRHHHAYVDGGRRHMGLRQHRSGSNIHQNIRISGDVPISLRHSSGHDRHSQRSVRQHNPRMQSPRPQAVALPAWPPRNLPCRPPDEPPGPVAL